MATKHGEEVAVAVDRTEESAAAVRRAGRRRGLRAARRNPKRGDL